MMPVSSDNPQNNNLSSPTPNPLYTHTLCGRVSYSQTDRDLTILIIFAAAATALSAISNNYASSAVMGAMTCWSGKAMYSYRNEILARIQNILNVKQEELKQTKAELTSILVIKEKLSEDVRQIQIENRQLKEETTNIDQTVLPLHEISQKLASLMNPMADDLEIITLQATVDRLTTMLGAVKEQKEEYVRLENICKDLTQKLEELEKKQSTSQLTQTLDALLAREDKAIQETKEQIERIKK